MICLPTRRLTAMFATFIVAAVASHSFIEPVFAAAPDANAPASNDKLLGGPDAYGDGYADPYGNSDRPGAKKTPSPDSMADEAAGAQLNGSFVKPGSTAMKSTRTARRARSAGATGDDTTGLNAGTPLTRKTTEIYKSPY